MQVGAKLNIVKDKNIDSPILRILDNAKAYIADQLREFTTKDLKTGKFIEAPEYPEFPWLEGIVNAVAHRDYAMTGAYIKVSQIEIAKRTGYSRSKVQRIMKNLTENNVVQRGGAKKNGVWRIII